MKDLFGMEIKEQLPKLTQFGKRKRDETPKGYAARPGSGPAGHFCRDCRHAKANRFNCKTYWKCWLRVREWTHSYGTDIRLKSPACEHWAPIVQIEAHSNYEFVKAVKPTTRKDRK